MEYEIQYARLITSEKLPDRFLNAQLKASTDLSKSQMGEIFTLVEILTPWFPTAQIGQTIIQTFFDAYYAGGSTSDLVNFETALKKVNESLATITQNGETDWLGNLNAILGVVIENKIHLAQTGKAEAYIFRDGKVNHLTEGLAQNSTEAHPLSTFSNITSGELKHNDKILIANPDLYKNLSLDNIRQIITLGETPSETILQIAKLLKKKKTKAVNVLEMNLVSSEELAKLPIENVETYYLDKPLESILSNVARFWNSLIYPIIKFVASRGKRAGNSSLDFTKNYLSTLKKKREEAQPIKKRDLFQKEFIDNSVHDDMLLKDEEINYSPELDVHYYNEAQKEKNNRAGKIFDKIFSSLWTVISKIRNFISNLYHSKKTRPYFYIMIAAILLIFIAVFIHFRHNSNNNLDLNQAQDILKQAETDEQNAKQALLSNDKDKAKILFVSAIQGANKISSFPVVGTDAQTVINDSYAELDKLTSTTRFANITPLLSLNNKADDVYVVSGYGVFASANDIYKGLISGGKIQKVANLPSDGGNVSFGTVIGTSIYLYTSTQKVYEFDTTSSKLSPVTINGSWETANAIASFSGSIYLLDGVIGQIYKHTSNSSGFDAGSAYITSKSINLNGSNSLAIDGALYVLQNNGQVKKLQKSKLQDFSLQNIPAPNSTIDKPLKIYTDADTSSLYILDGAQK